MTGLDQDLAPKVSYDPNQLGSEGVWQRARTFAIYVGHLLIGRRYEPTIPLEVGNNLITPEEAAFLMEQRGWVRTAPRLEDQAIDAERSNRYSYYSREGLVSKSEYEGLGELKTFLSESAKPGAKDMLQNLTFTGEKEIDEASRGFAAYWKRYLDADPDRQLCALTLISDTWHRGVVKSDKYLLERILEHFTDDELSRYSGRLVLDFNQLTAIADKAKIVLLDDWTISGQQMRDAYTEIREDIERLGYGSSVELNLIAASRKRLAGGLQVGKTKLPIKAHFVAHAAPTAEYGAFIGGIHTRVDLDYERHVIRLWEGDEPSITRLQRSYPSDLAQAKRLQQPSLAA